MTIPTICPICGGQLNIDDERMHSLYNENMPDCIKKWELTVSQSFWFFYCSDNSNHIGTYNLLSLLAELEKVTKEVDR